MTTVLQQAYDALEKARGTISRMQQRQPHVNYSNDALYGHIDAAKSALSKAIAQGGAMEAAQAHGAKVAVYTLGNLRIEDRTALGRPSAWAVSDGFGSCLSKAGELDDEPQPSSRTYEWLQEHRWHSAEEAINAAADYLAKAGGAT